MLRPSPTCDTRTRCRQSQHRTACRMHDTRTRNRQSCIARRHNHHPGRQRALYQTFFTRIVLANLLTKKKIPLHSVGIKQGNPAMPMPSVPMQGPLSLKLMKATQVEEAQMSCHGETYGLVWTFQNAFTPQLPMFIKARHAKYEGQQCSGHVCSHPLTGGGPCPASRLAPRDRF